MRKFVSHNDALIRELSPWLIMPWQTPLAQATISLTGVGGEVVRSAAYFQVVQVKCVSVCICERVCVWCV